MISTTSETKNGKMKPFYTYGLSDESARFSTAVHGTHGYFLLILFIRAYLLPLCFFSFTHIPIYSPTTLDPVLLPTQRSLPAHSGFLAQSPTPNTIPPPPALLDQAWEVGIAAVEARAAG